VSPPCLYGGGVFLALGGGFAYQGAPLDLGEPLSTLGSPPLRLWPPHNISGAAFRGVEMQWQGAVSLPRLFGGGSLAFGGVHPAWRGVG